MVLLIVSILVLVAALVLVLWARGKFKTAAELLDAAKQETVTQDAIADNSLANLKGAEHERELARALLAHVQKLEDSLVNPRFALDLKIGRIRALRYREDPRPGEEIETRDPDPDCRKCFGRGWSGRQRETGAVIPCPCVRRRGRP